MSKQTIFIHIYIYIYYIYIYLYNMLRALVPAPPAAGPFEGQRLVAPDGTRENIRRRHPAGERHEIQGI